MPLADLTQFGSLAWEKLLASAAPGGDPHGTARLAGRRVLITGAAGSIGSALTRGVLASAPASLLLLDTSENGLYELARDMGDVAGKVVGGVVGGVVADVAGEVARKAEFRVGSICDPPALARLFAEHRPQVVFHAAAYKHVPLMERNPFAAIANNALGTRTLAAAALAHGAEDLILVSTDKAADPASIMGASKRIAELAWLCAARAAGVRAAAVRLGNVLGTRGSVLPVFLDQLAREVPLTVTHEEAERYFMTMDRAVNALLGALEHGAPEHAKLEHRAGEGKAHAAILVPQLGPPLRILDLARHLSAQRGAHASITLTGMRPGDKLHERLLGVDERWSGDDPGHGPEDHPGLDAKDGLRAIETPLPHPAALQSDLDALEAAVRSGELSQLLHTVRRLVPHYEPSRLLATAAGPVAVNTVAAEPCAEPCAEPVAAEAIAAEALR